MSEEAVDFIVGEKALKAGFLSLDRTIAEYNRDIRKLKQIGDGGQCRVA